MSSAEGKDENSAEAAFTCLVAAYQKRLTAFAVRLLERTDRDAAQDVVQETFLALWRQMSNGEAPFTSPERMDLYLLRAVHNRCIDRLRQRTWHAFTSEDAEAPDISPGPEGTAHAALLADAVAAAVATLPVGQRSVFVLSHYEGLRYQQIADLLDCPIGTVASRKNQAVQSLRAALKDWMDGAGGGDIASDGRTR